MKSEHEHREAVDSDAEAAVRRAAVFEELEIELDILVETLLLRLALEHIVSVLALRAGGRSPAARRSRRAYGRMHASRRCSR